MFFKRFALEEDGRDRVTVRWCGTPYFSFAHNIRVLFDRELVGTIATRDELFEGRDFTLADGSILRVELTGTALEVEYQGQKISAFRNLKKRLSIQLFIVGAFLGLLTLVSVIFWKTDALWLIPVWGGIIVAGWVARKNLLASLIPSTLSLIYNIVLLISMGRDVFYAFLIVWSTFFFSISILRDAGMFSAGWWGRLKRKVSNHNG